MILGGLVGVGVLVSDSSVGRARRLDLGVPAVDGGADALAAGAVRLGDNEEPGLHERFDPAVRDGLSGPAGPGVVAQNAVSVEEELCRARRGHQVGLAGRPAERADLLPLPRPLAGSLEEPARNRAGRGRLRGGRDGLWLGCGRRGLGLRAVAGGSAGAGGVSRVREP
ncbi:hypothetical protein [Streptomyces sp. NPDC051219]|uniref:hypothetical protein n=1 Tax=Streptomyces sp. NPDC051219 TaxID=3155283 RepID=UPI003433FF03